MSFELTIHDLPHYSYSDYKLWEVDWELIRGIPYSMAPAPSWMHQELAATLFIAFLLPVILMLTCQGCFLKA